MPSSTHTYLDHVMGKNIKQFNKAVHLVTVFVNSSQCLVAGRGIVNVEVVIPTVPVILLLYLFLCHFSPSRLSFQYIGLSHHESFPVIILILLTEKLRPWQTKSLLFYYCLNRLVHSHSLRCQGQGTCGFFFSGNFPLSCPVWPWCLPTPFLLCVWGTLSYLIFQLMTWKQLYDLRDLLSSKIMSRLIQKQYIAVMLLCFTLLRHVKDCIHPKYSQSHPFIYSLIDTCLWNEMPVTGRLPGLGFHTCGAEEWSLLGCYMALIFEWLLHFKRPVIPSS